MGPVPDNSSPGAVNLARAPFVYTAMKRDL